MYWLRKILKYSKLLSKSSIALSKGSMLKSNPKDEYVRFSIQNQSDLQEYSYLLISDILYCL